MTANPSSRGTTLLYGPSYSRLRRAAIGRADDTAADTPASVLWLERNSHLQETVAETWAADHAPLRLRVSGLNDVANEAYDRLTGPRERLDALTRRRIVDRALRELDDANILDDAHRYRDEVLSLFSTLEAAGYNSPDALDDLLSRSALPSHADTVLTEAYRRYRNHLDEVLTDEEYPGFEAYHSERPTLTPSFPRSTSSFSPATTS